MELKAQALTDAAFRRYGRFASMAEPSGAHIGQEPILFYRDLLPLGCVANLVASVTAVQPLPLVVDVMEYHTATGEGFLNLDADALICVGEANAEGEPQPEKFEAFFVPAGTMVYLHPGVWHYAPFPLGGKTLHSLVLLPERTYANDCMVRRLPPEQQITLEP